MEFFGTSRASGQKISRHEFCSFAPGMTSRKQKRSIVYHLLNTIVPCNHKLKAELDVLGAVVIIALVAGIVAFAAYLVR